MNQSSSLASPHSPPVKSSHSASLRFPAAEYSALGHAVAVDDFSKSSLSSLSTSEAESTAAGTTTHVDEQDGPVFSDFSESLLLDHSSNPQLASLQVPQHLPEVQLSSLSHLTEHQTSQFASSQGAASTGGAFGSSREQQKYISAASSVAAAAAAAAAAATAAASTAAAGTIAMSSLSSKSPATDIDAFLALEELRLNLGKSYS